MRTSAGEKTIFAMHKRTSGPGVSPPWIGERTCKGALDITRETAGDSSANAVAVALPQARQADTCRCRRGTFSRRNRIPVSTRLPIHRRPTYAADVYVQ